MDVLRSLFSYVYEGILDPLASLVVSNMLITLFILAILVIWVGIAYKGKLK
jgi:hypothetical protein